MEEVIEFFVESLTKAAYPCQKKMFLLQSKNLLKGPIEIICFEVATYIKLVIKKYIGSITPSNDPIIFFRFKLFFTRIRYFS